MIHALLILPQLYASAFVFWLRGVAYYAFAV